MVFSSSLEAAAYISTRSLSEYAFDDDDVRGLESGLTGRHGDGADGGRDNGGHGGPNGDAHAPGDVSEEGEGAELWWWWWRETAEARTARGDAASQWEWFLHLRDQFGSL